jgi:transposase
MILRYFGIDIHKHYVVIAAVDEKQQTLLEPTRVEMDDLSCWVKEYLTREDTVALEVSSNSWPIVDLLRTVTDEVIAANPYKTKLIAEAQIKNDKVDALALARLLASNFICDVWVPDADVRDQRALAAHRATLQKQCTRIKNRLHNVLHRHNLRCPEKSLFSKAGRQWLLSQALSQTDSLQVRHLLRQLALLEEEWDETDRLIARQACQDPRVPRLMQMAGIGYYTAFAILAAIGDINRFAAPEKLAAYFGLVPRQHQSGGHAFYGHITKAGNPLARWVMTEAARAAVRWDPHWHQVHERIARRRGSNIATVAVARKMLTVIWHLLTDYTVYHHLRPQTFVTKLQAWGYRIGHRHLPADSTKEFVYDHLSALGLEDMADSISAKGRNGRLRVHPA